MLIGIDARMTPELLFTLAQMGHGDELVIVDTNFPAASIAAHCAIDTPLQVPGLDAAGVAELICSVFPLDDFVPHCALRMQIDGKPDELNEAHRATFDVLENHMSDKAALGSIERQAFYERAKTAFAIVQCTETQPYANFVLRKGVVF